MVTKSTLMKMFQELDEINRELRVRLLNESRARKELESKVKRQAAQAVELTTWIDRVA